MGLSKSVITVLSINNSNNMLSHHGYTEQFRVEHKQSFSTSLTFEVILEGIKPTPSSTIILNIYKQDIENGKENVKKIGNIYLKYPFKEYYTIEDLSPLQNYKINFFLTVDQNTYHATLFANTINDPNKPKKFKYTHDPQGILQKSNKAFSCTEDLLFKYTEAKSTNLKIYNNEKDLKKNILDARAAKEYKDYQSSGYKFAKPKSNFETRKKRIWLVANGLEIYDEVYDLVKRGKGYNVLEGDWFMGPFYSYDKNVKKQ